MGRDRRRLPEDAPGLARFEPWGFPGAPPLSRSDGVGLRINNLQGAVSGYDIDNNGVAHGFVRTP